MPSNMSVNLPPTLPPTLPVPEAEAATDTLLHAEGRPALASQSRAPSFSGHQALGKFAKTHSLDLGTGGLGSPYLTPPPKEIDITKADVCIKTGTEQVVDAENGYALRSDSMRNVARQISDMLKAGRNCFMVASGSVGMGVGVGIKQGYMEKRPTDSIDKKVTSMIGNVAISAEWEKVFAEFGIGVAGLYIDKNGLTNNREQTKSVLRKAMENKNVITIINENDATVTGKTALGNNDMNAAVLANIADMDYLVLCTNVTHMYTDDPRKNRDAKKIDEVRIHDPEELEMARDSAKGAGTESGTEGGRRRGVREDRRPYDHAQGRRA